MSSCDSQGGKAVGVLSAPLYHDSLGIRGGRGLRDPRKIFITVSVPRRANSFSASPGSCSQPQQNFVRWVVQAIQIYMRTSWFWIYIYIYIYICTAINNSSSNFTFFPIFLDHNYSKPCFNHLRKRSNTLQYSSGRKPLVWQFIIPFHLKAYIINLLSTHLSLTIMFGVNNQTKEMK